MPHTTRKRYAVVSCHVERPLDDAVWARFSTLQERRPGGFAVAALIRPPDPASGEDESVWVERARAAAVRGPLGHHTHWTAPDHARPTEDAEAEAGAGWRVLAESARVRQRGVVPTLFCGGGWYTDADVLEACAGLRYVDCTPRATRPRYLGPDERWAFLREPARIRLPSGRLLPAVPTTHSVGDLVRALVRPRSLPRVVHVYFHDTDLLQRRRRLALAVALRALARRSQVTDLDALAATVVQAAPEIGWADVVRI